MSNNVGGVLPNDDDDDDDDADNNGADATSCADCVTGSTIGAFGAVIVAIGAFGAIIVAFGAAVSIFAAGTVGAVDVFAAGAVIAATGAGFLVCFDINM